MSSDKKKKRTWVYVNQPASYGIPGHSCGSKKYTWSEFQKHLWCYKCEVDFIPKENGVFDGPIPVTLASMMGYDFRRMNLKTKKLMRERA